MRHVINYGRMAEFYTSGTEAGCTLFSSTLLARTRLLHNKTKRRELNRTGPPFRGSAIPGVRVRVIVRVNPSGPPEWRTGIELNCMQTSTSVLKSCVAYNGAETICFCPLRVMT